MSGVLYGIQKASGDMRPHLYASEALALAHAWDFERVVAVLFTSDLAALRECVRKADAMPAPINYETNLDVWLCRQCDEISGAFSPKNFEHDPECPYVLFLAARARVTLPEDAPMTQERTGG